MPNNTPKGERKRTNFRLPRDLHKAIKIEAVETGREMTEIIVEQLSTRYPQLEGVATHDGAHNGKVEQKAA